MFGAVLGSIRILKLCERMWKRAPIGSNAEEAQEGQTKPDYIAKMTVSRTESRETLYWLRVAVRVDVVTAHEVEWELHEASELRAMIIGAIRTAQSSPSRG